jgi:tRNA pseudouridine38-40 synthase
VKQSARSRVYEYLGPLKLFIKEGTGQVDSDQEAKTLERLRNLSSKFKGTHNFHNYTKAMKATDPRANRYIMRFDCDYVDYPEGKYVKFIIQGQSFIYHQIRKMIGIMIQVIQTGHNDQLIDNSFFNNAVNIWLAPPQGLLLDRVTFDGYNKKKDIPELLEFNENEVKR